MKIHVLTAAAAALVSCSSDAGDPTRLKTVAAACTRITGCLGLSVDACASTLLGRVGFPRLDAESVKGCVKQAADCSAVGRCLNAGAPAGTCDSDTDERRCDGTVGRRCVGGVWVGFDCAALGLECLQDSVGQLWCGRQGPCADGECHQGGVISCVNQVMAYESCGTGSCLNVDGSMACAGEGPSCDSGDFRCEGNTAVTCRNGKEHREPCAVCSDIDGAFCKPDTQCERSSCSGTSLIACVEGVAFEQSCTASGFSACSTDGTGARCQ